MADVLQSDRRITAFATVSGHFSLREATVTNPLVPEEFRQAMYAKSNAARQAYFETGVAEADDMLMPDMPEAVAEGVEAMRQQDTGESNPQEVADKVYECATAEIPVHNLVGEDAIAMVNMLRTMSEADFMKAVSDMVVPEL